MDHIVSLTHFGFSNEEITCFTWKNIPSTTGGEWFESLFIQVRTTVSLLGAHNSAWSYRLEFEAERGQTDVSLSPPKWCESTGYQLTTDGIALESSVQLSTSTLLPNVTPNPMPNGHPQLPLSSPESDDMQLEERLAEMKHA